METRMERYTREQNELATQRQELIDTLTLRQMSARIKRELGIKASAIVLFQSNDADINRVAWAADIEGVGWLAVTQNYTGQWDPKREAERSARIEVYLELLIGGQDLVDSIRRNA